MENELKILLERQADVQELMEHPMRKKGEPIKENCLALIVEVTEVLNEISWKPWSKLNEAEINGATLEKEILDCFLFWLNLVNEAPLDHTTLFSKVIALQDEAIKRHAN